MQRVTVNSGVALSGCAISLCACASGDHNSCLGLRDVLKTPTDVTIIGQVKSHRRIYSQDKSYNNVESIFEIVEIEVRQQVRSNGPNADRSVTALEAMLYPVDGCLLDTDKAIPARGLTYAFGLDIPPRVAP